jgi:hypothetical protein
MPDVGEEFDRTIPDDGQLHKRGAIVRLVEVVAPDREFRLIADRNGDHEVLEYARLRNLPGFFRARLRRIR